MQLDKKGKTLSQIYIKYYLKNCCVDPVVLDMKTALKILSVWVEFKQRQKD